MFYDERIEAVKGKIAKRSILMSVVIALVFFALRMINVLKNDYGTKHLWFLAIEFAIIFAGEVCLFVGEVLKKATVNDERTSFEQARFYNKAFPILIKITLFIFALIFPISVYQNIFADSKPDMIFGSILVMLLFTVGIYVIYSFKKEDVYFNYSHLDSPHYYKAILKNICKCALATLIMLCTSAFVFAIITVYKRIPTFIALRLFLLLLEAYIFFCLTLSLIYLIYSALEKASYESKSFVSKASIISLLITVILQGIWSAFVIYVNRLNISQSSTAVILSYVGLVSQYIIFALLMFLVYFGYEYKKENIDTRVPVFCKMILLSGTLAFLSDKLISCIQYIFMPELVQIETPYLLRQLLVTANNCTDALFKLATAIGIALLIIALIKDRSIHKANIFAIIILTVLACVEIFLKTQFNFLQVEIYSLVCTLTLLLYLAAITLHIGINSRRVGDN